MTNHLVTAAERKLFETALTRVRNGERYVSFDYEDMSIGVLVAAQARSEGYASRFLTMHEGSHVETDVAEVPR